MRGRAHSWSSSQCSKILIQSRVSGVDLPERYPPHPQPLLCECQVVPGSRVLLFSSCGSSLTARETDCYSWHDSDGRHTLVDAALSRAIPKALGSLSPETKLQQITVCSFCAASRRSLGPAVSSAVKGAVATVRPEAQTAVVVSRRHKCASSAYEPPPQWLCARPLLWDGAGRCGGRKPAVPDLCQSRSRRFESACCASGLSPVRVMDPRFSFIAGGVFAGDQAQKAGNLADVA